ncbi:hypothetical protein JZ751_021782 [Albula glossodonta]|uniref:Uncharacterized protein n=1 Tax=Albula glossodonta TaxID=121402 RepID=A0A8T2NM78_9TELE|nr:hypothetical protein JZ751_021782 [Albula glossodonta]
MAAPTPMDILVETLEELEAEELKRFKLKLGDRDTREPRIPRGKLEGATGISDLVKLLMNTYPNDALRLTLDLLPRVGRRDLAKRLGDILEQPQNNQSSRAGSTATETKETPASSSTATQLPDVIQMFQTALGAYRHFVKPNAKDYSYLFSAHKNLKWLPWEGSLPDHTVSIYNQDASRTDYVAKVNTCAGYYTPSKGPYCFYPLSDREERSRTFEVLVNVDGFELLEWHSGSWGSVPENAVPVNSNGDVFVARNRYGLGKMVETHKALFLPKDGKETFYKTYEVLTVSQEPYTQRLKDLEFDIDQVSKSRQATEILGRSVIPNPDDKAVTKKKVLKFSSVVSHVWDINRPVSPGLSTKITASLPQFDDDNVLMVSKEYQCHEGTMSASETKNHELPLEQGVPACSKVVLTLEGAKTTLAFPFTAKLSRTFRSVGIRETQVQGRYIRSEVSEVRAVVERVEKLRSQIQNLS